MRGVFRASHRCYGEEGRINSPSNVSAGKGSYGVSQSGYFAWKRVDLGLPVDRMRSAHCLAHIRCSAFCTVERNLRQPAHDARELRDDGITIGRHRVARLMRVEWYRLQARQRRRFKTNGDRQLARLSGRTKP